MTFADRSGAAVEVEAAPLVLPGEAPTPETCTTRDVLTAWLAFDQGYTNHLAGKLVGLSPATVARIKQRHLARTTRVGQQKLTSGERKHLDAVVARLPVEDRAEALAWLETVSA